jgi:hypothetical protein
MPFNTSLDGTICTVTERGAERNGKKSVNIPMRVLYERKNGTLILNLKGHSSSVLTFAIFPNGDYVGGSADTTNKI